MNHTAKKSEQMSNQNNYPSDEIELIDLLHIIWKWKWIIIGFTLFCVIFVAIYGFTRPVVKMYKVSAVIEINPEAKLDSLQKIKAEIEYGVYNQQILIDLPDTAEGRDPESLSFEVTIPNGLTILDIAYKTSDEKLGEEVLNSLAKQIKKKYEIEILKAEFKLDKAIDQTNYSIEQIQHNLDLIKKQSDLSLAGLKDKIEGHVVNIEALQEKINLAKNRVDQIEIIFKQAKIRSEKLAAEKMRSIINSHHETDYTNMFMDASAIHEIIDYPIVLRDKIDSLITEGKEYFNEILRRNQEINRLKKEIEIFKLKLGSEISNSEGKIFQLKSDIKLMKEDRERFAAVKIKQPNKVSPLYKTYKTQRNIILFGGTGFILSILFVYFMEYIMKVSEQSKKKY